MLIWQYYEFKYECVVYMCACVFNETKKYIFMCGYFFNSNPGPPQTLRETTF